MRANNLQPLKHGLKFVGRASAVKELLEDLTEVFGEDTNFHQAMFGCYIYPNTPILIETAYEVNIQ